MPEVMAGELNKNNSSVSVCEGKGNRNLAQCVVQLNDSNGKGNHRGLCVVENCC